MDFGDFGFTFVIPATKKILFKSGRKGKNYGRNYGSLNRHDQRDFMDNILMGACSLLHLNTKIRWVFEEHQDGRLHTHGIIYQEYDEIVELFRQEFYKGVGYKSPKCYLKYSDIRLLNNVQEWENYIDKQTILSKCQEERNNIRYMDYGYIKIDNRLEDYYNSLTTHLENLETPDADYYRFGKTQKKYIIDL